MRLFQRAVAGVLALPVLVSLIDSTRGAEVPEYNRDVRPILAENCFACHGPDSAMRKADLRVDQREIAVQMKAIVPGEPEASEMVRRILSDDPEFRMPPPVTKKSLTRDQKETLRKWIASGAEYEPHWSLITPRRPELPNVKDAAWVRNPIDAFILTELEARGLTPAPAADRRTLARRVSLDLTGLPPDPQLVEAFVSDETEHAYDKLVDTLLASPHWGEHRGRYWLDAARYADTHGIHFDNYREMWSYRDWVIEAFNQNMPFDQFTIEQLAGDLLPDRMLEQQIASGFNRCNITTNEGGAISEEYLVLYARDRTETVGQVFMGSTVGCAVCHDHKFDPFSQREFYQLAAFFNNTTQAAMDGNVKDTPPIVRVPLDDDRPRFEQLATAMPRAKEQVEQRREAARVDFDHWLATAEIDEVAGKVPQDDLHFHAALSEGSGEFTRVAVDDTTLDLALAESAAWQPGPAGGAAVAPQGALCELPDVGDFDQNQAFTAATWIKLPPNDSSGAIAARMDNGSDYRGWDFWMQRRQIGTHVIHRWPDNAVKVVSREQVPGNEWTHVAVSYDGSAKASGVKVYFNGQPQETNVEADTLSESTRSGVPFKIGQRHSSEILSGAALADLRIYRRALAPAEIQALAQATQFAAILTKTPGERTDGEAQQLYSWWLGEYDAAFKELAAEAARLEKEQADIVARGTIAHVMQEADSQAMAYVLNRGEYDQRRDSVEPGTPGALPPMADELPRNRLGLAEWLLRPEHPLTARVTVNRFWQQVFGTGLVRTAEDFGVMGELPSHPELLDWLAIEFRESNWDIKHFFKLLVTSATYRQASITTPEKLELDPDNRLISRGPRFRMDAEMIRDAALASSGLLVTKLGGPSVKPYQPPGVWEAVAMIGSNTRDYRQDEGENLYRRSLYTFWKRSAPPASMDIFNAPVREVCTVRRERTNTPLQALVTLNDVQFVEAARVLAERTLLSGESGVSEKLDYLMRRLLCRPLDASERPVVEASLQELLAYYREHPDDAAKLLEVGDAPRDSTVDASTHAAWTMLTNQLMNLDDVLNK